VSAGGINAAYLAARQEPFRDKVEDLAEIWRRPPPALAIRKDEADDGHMSMQAR
jgi:hypothetical protein